MNQSAHIEDGTRSASGRRAVFDPWHQLLDDNSPVEFSEEDVVHLHWWLLQKVKRVLSVLTDPACGYCRQLEQHLSVLQDVTIHYFLLPFQGRDMPMAIWCAPDRAAAYRAVMGDQPFSAKPATCPHPLDRNQAFATRIKVGATPTLMFADGDLVPGVMSADELETKLNAAAANPAIKERKLP